MTSSLAASSASAAVFARCVSYHQGMTGSNPMANPSTTESFINITLTCPHDAVAFIRIRRKPSCGDGTAGGGSPRDPTVGPGWRVVRWCGDSTADVGLESFLLARTAPMSMHAVRDMAVKQALSKMTSRVVTEQQTVASRLFSLDGTDIDGTVPLQQWSLIRHHCQRHDKRSTQGNTIRQVTRLGYLASETSHAAGSRLLCQTQRQRQRAQKKAAKGKAGGASQLPTSIGPDTPVDMLPSHVPLVAAEDEEILTVANSAATHSLFISLRDLYDVAAIQQYSGLTVNGEGIPLEAINPDVCGSSLPCSEGYEVCVTYSSTGPGQGSPAASVADITTWDSVRCFTAHDCLNVDLDNVQCGSAAATSDGMADLTAMMGRLNGGHGRETAITQPVSNQTPAYLDPSHTAVDVNKVIPAYTSTQPVLHLFRNIPTPNGSARVAIVCPRQLWCREEPMLRPVLVALSFGASSSGNTGPTRPSSLTDFFRSSNASIDALLTGGEKSDGNKKREGKSSDTKNKKAEAKKKAFAVRKSGASAQQQQPVPVSTSLSSDLPTLATLVSRLTDGESGQRMPKAVSPQVFIVPIGPLVNVEERKEMIHCSVDISAVTLPPTDDNEQTDPLTVAAVLVDGIGSIMTDVLMATA